MLQTGIEPAFVLFFDCPEEEMERRILNRNQVRPFWYSFSTEISLCFLLQLILFNEWDNNLGFQGRDDDNIETIRKRFKVFLQSSLPVVQYYESIGKVHKVNLQFENFTPFYHTNKSDISHSILDWCCKASWRSIWVS